MRVASLSAALGTLNGVTPVVFRLRRDGIADSNSRDFPNGSEEGGFLDRIEINYSGLPGAGIITAFCFLTYDLAGDDIASNEQTQLIRRGITTVTAGGVVFPAGGFVPKRDGSINGELFAWLWTNNGSAVPIAVARAVWFYETA